MSPSRAWHHHHHTYTARRTKCTQTNQEINSPAISPSNTGNSVQRPPLLALNLQSPPPSHLPHHLTNPAPRVCDSYHSNDPQHRPSSPVFGPSLLPACSTASSLPSSQRLWPSPCPAPSYTSLNQASPDPSHDTSPIPSPPVSRHRLRTIISAISQPLIDASASFRSYHMPPLGLAMPANLVADRHW